MPQMMPLNWLILMMFFLMLFFLIMNMIYFNKNFKPLNHSNLSSKKKLKLNSNWMW